MADVTNTDSRPGIGEYLVRKIYEQGARHVFGVPGDYILNFYAMLSRGPLQVINTCDEQGAGFAADAYARIHGLGVVCVTYNVGGFKVVNTTAEAYAEKSPVLVIAGAPGWKEREKYSLLHHKVRDYEDQFRIFERITVASTELRDPACAYQEIDRVIREVLRKKGPGYIELPRDIVQMIPGPAVHPRAASPDTCGDTRVPPAILDQIATRLNDAARPVIFVGEEIARHRMGPVVQALADKAQVPVVSTMLGKSAVDETSPLYLGVYAGVVGDAQVRDYVEASDCLLLLGVILNDVNLGANTAELDPDRMIILSGEGCTVGDRSYPGAWLDAIPMLGEHLTRIHDLRGAPRPQKERRSAFVPAHALITAERLFQALDSFLDESMVIVADVGDAAMGAMILTVPGPDRFLCPIYYSSLGFAVPAAIGVKAARPDLRPVVLVGDGAFQMTGMELSTASRYGMDPIVIVLNNGGYATERPMIDGPFNDIAPWRFHRIPDVIGAGRGFLVRTEDEFAAALSEARGSGDLSLIEVVLDPHDITPQLRRICERLGKGVKT